MNMRTETKIANSVKLASKDFINQQIEVLENFNTPEDRCYWHFEEDIIIALKKKMSKMTEAEILASLYPVKLGQKSVNRWLTEKRTTFTERDREYDEALKRAGR